MLTQTPGVGQRYIAAYKDREGNWLSRRLARIAVTEVRSGSKREVGRAELRRLLLSNYLTYLHEMLQP
jgi:hypothetical protein